MAVAGGGYGRRSNSVLRMIVNSVKLYSGYIQEQRRRQNKLRIGRCALGYRGRPCRQHRRKDDNCSASASSTAIDSASQWLAQLRRGKTPIVLLLALIHESASVAWTRSRIYANARTQPRTLRSLDNLGYL